MLHESKVKEIIVRVCKVVLVGMCAGSSEFVDKFLLRLFVYSKFQVGETVITAAKSFRTLRMMTSGKDSKCLVSGPVKGGVTVACGQFESQHFTVEMALSFEVIGDKNYGVNPADSSFITTIT